MKRLAILVLVIVAGTGISDASTPASASHSAGYLWNSLESGGNQTINYSICPASPPATWSRAIAISWDANLPSWQFNPAGVCNGDGVTSLDWEGALGNCSVSTYAACWQGFNLVSHGGHFDLGKAVILFDADPNNPHRFLTWGLNWQTALAAHEWGHTLALADHTNPDGSYMHICDINSLMGGYDPNRKAWDNPCLTGPSGNDLTSVWCTIYRTCTWQGWAPWGAWATPAPGGMAVEHHLSRPDFVHLVRSASPDFYERYWTGSVWTGWENRSSGPSDPTFNGATAISLNDNETHLVGATSGELWHKKKNAQGAWSAWSYVGRPSGTQPINGPIVVSNSGSRIDIVGVSNNISVFHRFSINGGQTWQTWEDRGGWATSVVLSRSRRGVAISTSSPFGHRMASCG